MGKLIFFYRFILTVIPRRHTQRNYFPIFLSVFYISVWVYSPSVSSSASCKQILLIRCTQPRRLNSTIDIPTYYTGSIYYDMSCMYSTIHIRSPFIYTRAGTSPSGLLGEGPTTLLNHNYMAGCRARTKKSRSSHRSNHHPLHLQNPLHRRSHPHIHCSHPCTLKQI